MNWIIIRKIIQTFQIGKGTRIHTSCRPETTLHQDEMSKQTWTLQLKVSKQRVPLACYHSARNLKHALTKRGSRILLAGRCHGISHLLARCYTLDWTLSRSESRSEIWLGMKSGFRGTTTVFHIRNHLDITSSFCAHWAIDDGYSIHWFKTESNFQ